jgi:two-component system, NtrC family, sensor histidine kinase KinB
MLGIRQKLSLGFAGLLAIILVIGVQSIFRITRLGESIDVILRENYRSVIACQDMKESLERVDSGLLFVLLGYTQEGERLIDMNLLAFERSLGVEMSNITLPSEGDSAAAIERLYGRYKAALGDARDSSAPIGRRREAYFNSLLPLFYRIKGTADGILQMNQKNMSDMNDRARADAASARRRMYALLLAGVVVAPLFIYSTGRWILHPINQLIRSADEIARGNLDLVVQSGSRDEIGHLSSAFNDMAASLREFRRSGQARLTRIQQATQRAFDSLPEAIAVIDLEGTVEVATESARTIFGLKPNVRVRDVPLKWVTDLYGEAAREGRTAPQPSAGRIEQFFVLGEERYFRPQAVPILDNERQPTGIILVLQDVTQLRQQDEMKRGVISTVSHQLKTPLTSIRMAIHLLLEERVGPLAEKQVELLLAAREDSDRLHGILNDLLDIGRIESGRVQMDFRPVSPHSMVLEAAEPFRRTAQDQGVTLVTNVPADAPEVWADETRIGHVFANLLSNALKYTPPGGTVTLSAETEETSVVFSISDTGKGIPERYLTRIFEQFFRVPDQGIETGAGLGLAIVKEIVEAHGGTVGVESREGQGSTFRFTLRRSDVIPKEAILS